MGYDFLGLVDRGHTLMLHSSAVTALCWEFGDFSKMLRKNGVIQICYIQCGVLNKTCCLSNLERLIALSTALGPS